MCLVYHTLHIVYHIMHIIGISTDDTNQSVVFMDQNFTNDPYQLYDKQLFSVIHNSGGYICFPDLFYEYMVTILVSSEKNFMDKMLVSSC